MELQVDLWTDTLLQIDMEVEKGPANLLSSVFGPLGMSQLEVIGPNHEVQTLTVVNIGPLRVRITDEPSSLRSGLERLCSD